MSLPAWWDGTADRKKQNRRSAKQEREHAKRMGGKVQAGSGSSWRAPQDVKTPIDEETGEGYLDECKGTSGRGFRVDRDYFLKLQRNALQAGREGRLFIEFRDPDTDELLLRLRIEEDEAD